MHKHLGEQDGRAVTKIFCWKDAVRAYSEALEFANKPDSDKKESWVEGVADTMDQLCEKVKEHVDQIKDSKDQVARKLIELMLKCLRLI